MKNKNRILTESEKKDIIKNKERAILKSFKSTFNRIKRLKENELSQNPVIIEDLTVSSDGSFEAEVYVQELGIALNGYLIGFELETEEYEPSTYDYPGNAGGVVDVNYNGFEYSHINIDGEFESDITEEIVMKLNSINENLVIMINDSLESKIADMLSDGYFNDEDFGSNYDPEDYWER